MDIIMKLNGHTFVYCNFGHKYWQLQHLNWVCCRCLMKVEWQKLKN